jgi:hypothetical protein
VSGLERVVFTNIPHNMHVKCLWHRNSKYTEIIATLVSCCVVRVIYSWWGLLATSLYVGYRRTLRGAELDAVLCRVGELSHDIDGIIRNTLPASIFSYLRLYG